MLFKLKQKKMELIVGLKLVSLILTHSYFVSSRTIDRKTKFRASNKDGNEPTNTISCGIQCSRKTNCTGYEVSAGSMECSLLDAEDADPSLGHWTYIKANSTVHNVDNSTEENADNSVTTEANVDDSIEENVNMFPYELSLLKIKDVWKTFTSLPF